MLRMSRSGPLLMITGMVYGLSGLVLLVGGVQLLLLGGSLYYLLAGLGLTATGMLLLRPRREALWLYALLLVGTTAWAVVEVRFDWWQLLPRLDVWFVLGLWLWLPFVNRRLRVLTEQRDVRFSLGRWALGGALVLVGAVGVGALLHPANDLSGAVPAVQMSARGADAAPFTALNDWTASSHSGFADHYAPARQLTPRNVPQLQLAWSVPVSDLKGANRALDKVNEVTPLKANGMLYLCTPGGAVVALDPDTGKQRWHFDPTIEAQANDDQSGVCRGVAYHDSGAYFEPGAAAWLPASSTSTAAAVATTVVVPKGAVAVSAIHFDECPRRILFSTTDATVVAINADTGKRCESFGEHGMIGVTGEQSMQQHDFLRAAMPPVATRHVLLVSGAVAGAGGANEPFGVLRGYAIDTGKLLWSFAASSPATAPMTAGQRDQRYSPYSWSVPSVDEKLGLVYFFAGNPAADAQGDQPGLPARQFNSAIVALDIASGQMRWVHQTVHHDAWLMGVGGQPSLLDLDTVAGKIPALLASTRRGDIYVLDRRDGRLLKPAPTQALSHGAAEPVHALAALSYMPKPLRARDMWGVTPFDQLMCRITFKKYRYDGVSTSRSAGGSVVYPGADGVFGRGGIAVDPVRQLALFNLHYVASLGLPHPRREVAMKHGEQAEPVRNDAVALQPLLSPLGLPCQAPPWGYHAALDLTTMQTVWMHQDDAVEYRALAGAASTLDAHSLGGPLLTGGGVVFFNGAPKHDLRAYNVRDGKLLWQSRQSTMSQAGPMSYVSDKTGRQYVVVMAAKHDPSDGKTDNLLVAYALPASPPPHKAAVEH